MCTIRPVACGMVNCHILSGSDGCILIDTGNAGSEGKIVRALDGSRVNLILLTHGHTDHCGAAAILSKQLDAPIAMHEADAELIERPVARKLYAHTPLGRVLAKASMFTMANTPIAHFKPDLLVEDGFDLSKYGVSARVVALPGHTKGSVGVLTDGGDMIVGDAAFNMLRPTGARIYEDRRQMEESLAKIKRLCKGLIYVGHGKPFEPRRI